MSHESHSCGPVVSPVASCDSSAFLNPPETPTSEKDVPFKPPESDSTSLDMKSRHKNDSLRRRRKGPFMGVTSKYQSSKQTNMVDAKFAPVSRMKSMSDLPLPTATGRQQENERQPLQSRQTTGRQPRRWTLPTKSTPTRGLTNLQPTVKQGALNEGKESPAMITLRRATTTGKKARKRTSLTFFPEPTFDKHRPNLFSYLASTFTGDCASQSRPSPLLAETFHSSSSASAENVSVRAAIGVAAQPVQTEISMEPTITVPGALRQLPVNRRCSTKYMSDMSLYEIIWDQNDNSSAETESSRPSVGSQTNVRRRHSMAVEKLETQLLKSEAQSRRASRHREDITRKTSSAAASEQSSRKSFQDIIDMSLSRLINEAALKNLPRSRASKKSKQPPPIIESEAAIHQTISGETYEVTWCENELFPPRDCQKGNHYAPENNGPQSKAIGTRTNSVALQAKRSTRRLGSLIGSSSHIRRRSTQAHVGASQDWHEVSGQVAKGIGKPGIVAEDQLPLLNPLKWEERSP